MQGLQSIHSTITLIDHQSLYAQIGTSRKQEERKSRPAHAHHWKMQHNSEPVRGVDEGRSPFSAFTAGNCAVGVPVPIQGYMGAQFCRKDDFYTQKKASEVGSVLQVTNA